MKAIVKTSSTRLIFRPQNSADSSDQKYQQIQLKTEFFLQLTIKESIGDFSDIN